MKQKRPSVMAILALVLSSHQVMATPPEQFDYMLNCQGCHLPDGRGFPAHNVPDLREHMAKFLTVEGGREFLVQVPGSAQSDLSDTDLARVLNWMLESFSPAQIPTGFAPYTSAEVARLRQEPLIQVSDIRQQLINKIREHEDSH